MKCLDDHLADCLPLTAHSLSTESTSVKYATDKVVYKVHWKVHSSATNKAMSHRSALSRLHCPLWAVLFCITYAIASVESVALRPSRSLSNSSAWSTLSSPFEPLLALNSSSFHSSKEDLHNILTPLTDDEHEEAALYSFQQDQVNRNGRPKREVLRRRTRAADDNVLNQFSERAKKHRNKKVCYKTALKKCGRIFVNSYRFVRVKRNKDNDIMIAQCALRTAFFDCLKARADSCNANPTDPKPIVEQNIIEKRKKKKEKKNTNGMKTFPKDLGQKFKNKLADTIWASRVCIFRQSIQG